MDFEKFLPALIAGIAVFGLGYFNIKMLQSKDKAGVATGNPNYMYLALAAFIGAAGMAFIQDTDFYHRL